MPTRKVWGLLPKAFFWWWLLLDHGMTTLSDFMYYMCISPLSRPGWRHATKMLSTLLALCEGNLLVSSRFHSQRASNVELWWFLCSSPEQTIVQTVKLLVISETIMFIWHNCNAIKKPCSVVITFCATHYLDFWDIEMMIESMSWTYYQKFRCTIMSAVLPQFSVKPNFTHILQDLSAARVWTTDTLVLIILVLCQSRFFLKYLIYLKFYGTSDNSFRPDNNNKKGLPCLNCHNITTELAQIRAVSPIYHVAVGLEDLVFVQWRKYFTSSS